MEVEDQDKKLINGSAFKVVSLLGSLFIILAGFIGAVTWVSVNMADNSVSITALEQGHLRHESLITKNAEIIQQHAQLLAILKEQGAAIATLNNFMTEGGRFTEADGRKLHDELQAVKDRLQHYQVLEVELGWIKKSIARMEAGLAKRFESLHKKLDVTKKDRR